MEVTIAASVAAALAVLVCLGWAVGIYNNLVLVRNNVEKAFQNIDVLLQQRHDELTNLIAAVQGYLGHEKTLFASVTELRERYRRAPTSAEKAALENELNRCVQQIALRVEAYPEIKADQLVRELMARVTALESAIADRRAFFNDSIAIFNTQIERFPDLLLAAALGYTKRGYLDVPAEKKADVRVALAPGA
jgi:LemA protein